MNLSRLPLLLLAAPFLLNGLWVNLGVRANNARHVDRIVHREPTDDPVSTEPGRTLLENTTAIVHDDERAEDELSEPADSPIFTSTEHGRKQLENATIGQEPKQHGLEVEEGGGEGDELPSCNDVLLHEKSQDRCHHAKNCEGEYIMTALLPLAFCKDPSDPSALHSHPVLLSLFPILFPLSLLLVTLLLFRLLGSTAENYFSPALEMISSEFNIPPALAGVTLLALGNGAPDVSAVVNAIKMNASEGIPLSLGELTGGGMFVQTVVVGRIVFLGSSVADGKSNLAGEKILGVTCREELMRDITMYAISAGYVLWMCSRGVIFYRHVVAMLMLYLSYVSVVVLFEGRRYYSKSESFVNGNSNGNGDEEVSDRLLQEDSVSIIHTNALSFDEEDQTVELSSERRVSPESLPENEISERPDPPGIKQSTRVLRMLHKQQMRQRQKLLEKRKSLVVENKDPQDRPPATKPQKDTEDRPWSFQLFSDSLHELSHHFYNALYTDIFSNDQLSRFERFCMSFESPFIILRKLVTPIPCQAEYNRSLVAWSIACSPLWIFFYLSTKMDEFNPFCIADADEGAGYCFPSVFWACCISFAMGCAVIKYFPEEEHTTVLPLHHSLPIALYGFLIAATWIDVVSDQLVNVLEFVGLLLKIPSPVMGMTVLAWGNSVGDYTTNGILAQKGLADMSMAACFAGPSFNLLVGLGCGLLTQKDMLLSNDGLKISLGPSVQTGFVFLICNCTIAAFSGFWNKGVIPKMHGYIFWAMYFAYMSISAQHLTI